MPILDWLNKDKAVKAAQQVQYRLLQPVSELSAGQDTGNMLIQGDNLEALKSLVFVRSERRKRPQCASATG